MLTVLVRIRMDYLNFMFTYYGCLYDRCREQAKERLEKQQMESYKYWDNKCLWCVNKRQKALNKMLSLRGYIV